MLENNLCVIIPTLNNIGGLNYLLNYFKNTQYEVVAVDNKKKNLGFAGGVNKGAEGVKTKWMLILNDDIEFPTDPIKILIQYAEEKKLDAVSPILRNPNGEIENFGYKVLPIGKIELVREMNSRLRGNDNNIDGITAACLLVKTEVFKKLGGFDEKFFAYLEDVDFFLRFKKAGYKMGIADVEVLHNHMTTTKTMGNFKNRQDMVNWWRLFFKHPNKFKFNIQFLIERSRNISGYIKASL
jgi:GT2 family glycosyltransferase